MMKWNFGKQMQDWFRKPQDQEVEMFKYGKRISRQMISAYEREIGYRFPPEFKAVALEHDGAVVLIRVFDTPREDREINNLLSFDKNAPASIWSVPDYEDESYHKKYVIFAEDGGGNYICFDRKDDSIVFIDHEDEVVEYVAPSFRAFLGMLRRDED